MAGNDVNQLVNFVFPDLRNTYRDAVRLLDRALLSTINGSLAALNIFVGDIIRVRAIEIEHPGEIDNPEKCGLRQLGKRLNSTRGTASLLNHQISLKTPNFVIVLRNLRLRSGRVNRAKSIEKSTTDKILFLQIGTRNNKGDGL